MRFGRHPYSEEDLTAYVDGELSRAQSERVEAHLRSCDACSSFVSNASQLKSLVGSLSEETTDRSFFWPGVAAAYDRRRASSGFSRRLPSAVGFAVLAALLIAGGATAFVLSTTGDEEPSVTQMATRNQTPAPTPGPAAVVSMLTPLVEPPASTQPIPTQPASAPALAPTRQAPQPPQPSPARTGQQPSQAATPPPPAPPTPAPQTLLLPPATQPAQPPQPTPARDLVTPTTVPSVAALSAAAPPTGTLSVSPTGGVAVGRSVTICFTLSRAVQTRILDQQAGQSAQVLLTNPASDLGHCQGNLQVTPPLGLETFILQYLEGSNWVELARVTITVVQQNQ